MSPDYLLFATASDDGSVKLWDLQKLDGRSLINKSRQTHIRTGKMCCLSAKKTSKVAGKRWFSNSSILPVFLSIGQVKEQFSLECR